MSASLVGSEMCIRDRIAPWGFALASSSRLCSLHHATSIQHPPSSQPEAGGPLGISEQRPNSGLSGPPVWHYPGWKCAGLISVHRESQSIELLFFRRLDPC
eukprot:13353941-Alexandrium_andersonii.AAC.1